MQILGFTISRNSATGGTTPPTPPTGGNGGSGTYPPPPPRKPRGSPSSMNRFFTKWLIAYARWTLPILGIALLAIGWVLYTLGGHGAWKFAFVFVSILIVVSLYHMSRRHVGSDDMPEVEVHILAALLFSVLFCWFFWALKPEWYAEWRNSTFFPLFFVTGMTLAWLSSHSNDKVAKFASAGLGLLLITAIGFGAARKWNQKRDTDKFVERTNNTIYCATNPLAERCLRDSTYEKMVYASRSTTEPVPVGYYLYISDQESLRCTHHFTKLTKQLVLTTKPGIDSLLVMFSLRKYRDGDVPRDICRTVTPVALR